MSENIQLMKQDRERRYAILITALQDFMGADTRYTNELENLLSVEKKTMVAEGTKKTPIEKARARKIELENKEKEVKKEDAKPKKSVHE